MRHKKQLEQKKALEEEKKKKKNQSRNNPNITNAGEELSSAEAMRIFNS